MKNFILFFMLILAFNIGFSQDSTKIQKLEKRIKLLEEKMKKNSLESILKEAESTSSIQKKKSLKKLFKGGQRSLQAINPEISLSGDAFSQYIMNDDNFTPIGRTGNYFRGVGLHIQSDLDPFSFAKVAIGVDPHGLHLGEAYLTWNNFLPNISLTFGKFRQQFGAINRWHKHALDQFDFPLALQTILGPEGLNQTGFSFNWLMPSILGGANNLIVELTNGENEHIFAGEDFSFPVFLGRFKKYYDLNQNTYLEFGVSAMMGNNNFRGYNDKIKTTESYRKTKLGGIDLSLFWEPSKRAQYKSFLWRSELFYINKEIADNKEIETWGGYTYGEYKFSERWQIGLRFDLTEPFEENNNNHYIYQIVPYVNWWQSHWVKIRSEYNFLHNNFSQTYDKTLRLQIVWAIGPHKHDRY